MIGGSKGLSKFEVCSIGRLKLFDCTIAALPPAGFPRQQSSLSCNEESFTYLQKSQQLTGPTRSLGTDRQDTGPERTADGPTASAMTTKAECSIGRRLSSGKSTSSRRMRSREAIDMAKKLCAASAELLLRRIRVKSVRDRVMKRITCSIRL